jgi:hypothetical protein
MARPTPLNSDKEIHGMTEKLISRTVDTDRHGYSLTRTHSTQQGQIVRVRVYRPRDSAGAGEPSATAAVYAHAENEWKSVTELGSMDWYAGTTDVDDAAIFDQLNPAATMLYEQARTILSYERPSASSVLGIETIASVEHIDGDGQGAVIAVYPDLWAAHGAVMHINGAVGATRVQMGSTLLVSPTNEQLLDFVQRTDRCT